MKVVTYLGLLSCNSVDGKSALDIIHQTEIFTSLVNGNDIYREKIGSAPLS